MINTEPEAGDLYILDATKSFALEQKTFPIWVDVRVVNVNQNFVYCTVANVNNILPIKKDVFMRVVNIKDPNTQKYKLPNKAPASVLIGR